MIGFAIEGWRTLRIGAGSFVQEEERWIDLAAYRDVSLWLQVKSVQVDGFEGACRLHYEVAPDRDDGLFRSVAEITLGSWGSSPLITTTPVVTSIALRVAPEVPLARWLRWRMRATFGSAGACFSLAGTATPVGG